MSVTEIDEYRARAKAQETAVRDALVGMVRRYCQCMDAPERLTCRGSRDARVALRVLRDLGVVEIEHDGHDARGPGGGVVAVWVTP